MHSLRLLWAARNEESLNRRRIRNTNRRRMERILEMPDLLFRERFRLNKQTFQKLCEDLRARTSLRGTVEIPLEVKVLCTLSFLATGSYQRIVGVTQHLLQRTTSRCIRQVVDAINENNFADNWIVFPQSHEERTRIKQEFQRKYHIPGVIGCIDCTHIAIVKPSDDEHIFFNRKGYHSLNVQMICDDNMRIMNVNAKFGGGTHDSFIWSSSGIESYMRALHQSHEQVWLLGDSGYPQRAWLMTPIINAPLGSAEELYTRRHIHARNCIERCFGLLKSRWRCLLRDRTLHYHPLVATKIILACCILHNIAVKANLPNPDPETLDEDDNVSSVDVLDGADGSQNELIRGRAVLNSLVNRLR